MGALTSKTYTYKGRPWELRSKDTISLKDPFLPTIRVQMINKQILRILPLAGEEEWLGNFSRFFESRPLSKQYTITLFAKSALCLMKNTLIETETYSRETVLESALKSMSNDIQEKQELSFVLDAETDITVYDALRTLDSLVPAINIIAITPNGSKEIQNQILDEEDLKQHEIVLMTQIQKNSPLFSAKLDDFVEEGGNLSTYSLPASKNFTQASSGAAKSVLNKLTSGHTLTKANPFVFASPYFSNYFTADIKKFVLGTPANNAVISGTKMNAVSGVTNILTDVKNIKILEETKHVVYSANMSYKRSFFANIFIPTVGFWNKDSIYKNVFGKIIHTPTVLNTPSNIAFVDLIAILRKYLYLVLFCY